LSSADYAGLPQGHRKGGLIGPEILKTIEDHPAWDYPWWWPRLSKVWNASVTLPSCRNDLGRWQEIVGRLHDHLHHIEVVSIILRFVYPEEFGIISPPVLSLLQLTPHPDSVTYYLQYTAALRSLRDHYGLRRAADVDMALWSAAHLYLDPQFAALTDAMAQDEYFQQKKLENLFRDWRGLSRQSAPQQMMLARVLSKYDHLLAALITGRVYESLLRDLGIQHGVHSRTQTPGQSKMGALVARLERIDSLGISPKWWKWRNDSIHPERQISRANAEQFVEEVSQFCRRIGI
jgi:hypothetical protein